MRRVGSVFNEDMNFFSILSDRAVCTIGGFLSSREYTKVSMTCAQPLFQILALELSCSAWKRIKYQVLYLRTQSSGQFDPALLKYHNIYFSP